MDQVIHEGCEKAKENFLQCTIKRVINY
jgi:hypothetical protein